MLAVPLLGAIIARLRLLWAIRDFSGLIILKPLLFAIGPGVAAYLAASYAVIGGCR